MRSALHLRPFLMGYFGCPHNDLVISKENNDSPLIYIEILEH